MSLFLAEIVTDPSIEVTAVLHTVQATLEGAGGELVESQVTTARDRIFVIIETDAVAPIDSALSASGLTTDPVAPVRLVGADLAQVKAQRPASGYLVEWDLPDGLTMEAYLARKKEKSPLYAQVPETTFQRTYVREDMVKCLCFYEAPDEEAVLRAREVVGAPVSRLHGLADLSAASDL